MVSTLCLLPVLTIYYDFTSPCAPSVPVGQSSGPTSLDQDRAGTPLHLRYGQWIVCRDGYDPANFRVALLSLSRTNGRLCTSPGSKPDHSHRGKDGPSFSRPVCRVFPIITVSSVNDEISGGPDNGAVPDCVQYMHDSYSL